MNDDPNLKAQNPFVVKLHTGLRNFSGYALFFLLSLFVFRLVELILVQVNLGLPHGFWILLFQALKQDLLFWLSLLPATGILFLALSLFSSRFAKVLYAILLIVFFALHVLFIYYHKESLLLLGSDVFGYSYDDVAQTVGASGVLSLTSLAMFLIGLGLLVSGVIYVLPKLRLKWTYTTGILLLAFVLSLFRVTDSTTRVYSDDFGNNLVTNKSRHFYAAALDYYFEEDVRPDIYANNYLAILERRLAQQNTFEYTYPEYPFLHAADTTDVLSSFFKKKASPPNLVFIVVEGLGRGFTNEGAILGNFTPFLDSLSRQSLYFKNMLSNGGRTFAVLPSLLGSQPFAENGFLALQDKMPAQLSLLNILEKNGYTTRFYYGGNASFDNMDAYLKLNKIDRIADEPSFPSGYSKLPEYAGYTWGYGDKELYDYYLESTVSDTTQAPRLDVLLTVTTHSPFRFNQQEAYLKRFDTYLESLNLKPEESAQRKKFADQFATVLYADDALQRFFKEYQKRSDYQNTIFFITGDHRIPEIPLSTKIDRYHVPLIVYSPMLTRTKEVQAISSHMDVAPSVLNYLNHSYNLALPKQNAFLGKGLDTVESFRNTHQIPLMQTKTDFVDFVMGNYHLNGDQLFQIYPNLYEELITDEIKKDELKAAFNAFKRRNREIAEGQKLVPDSLVLKYAQ